MLRTTAIVLSALHCILHTAPVNAATISLYTQAALQDVRSCVKVCIAGSGYGLGHIDLGQAVGCDSDVCFCREDLRPTASQYLSSCIFTDFTTCSNSNDYAAAATIYDNYCSFTGPATTPARTTSANVNTIIQGATATVTSTVTVRSSSTSITQPLPSSVGSSITIEANRPQSSTSSGQPAASTSSATGSSDGSSGSRSSDQNRINIIGIVVGVIVAVLCCIGGVFLTHWLRKRHERKIEEKKAREAAASGAVEVQGMHPGFPPRSRTRRPESVPLIVF